MGLPGFVCAIKKGTHSVRIQVARSHGVRLVRKGELREDLLAACAPTQGPACVSA